MKKQKIDICQQNLFDIEAIEAKPIKIEKGDDDYVFDMMDALSSPVLTFSLQWASTIPERMLDILPMARMIALMQKEQLATYVECVIYIYTRTLEAPMDRDWADIYTHVSCKTLQDHFNEDRWDDIQAPKELSEWLFSKLDGLRRHIYQERRKILKSRLRTDNRTEAKIQREESHQEEANLQQSLFL